MVLSSKSDESDGNKTFEVYFSYILVASHTFKQTQMLIDKGSVLWFILKKMALCYGLYCRKKCDFLKLGNLFSHFVRARNTRHF